MSGKLKQCMRESIGAAESIAAGDLARPLPVATKDDLGKLNAALSVMRNNLHELIANVHEGIVSLKKNSGECLDLGTQKLASDRDAIRSGSR